MMKKSRIVICFILMLLVCWIGYTLLIENDALVNTTNKVRNVGSFLWIIIIGLIGYWGLDKNEKWVKILWTWFYIIGLIILVTAGFLSWYVLNFSINIKGGIANFKLFYESPLPFLLILIISGQTKK